MNESEKIICPYCNAELNSDVKKCKFCGEWIVSDTDELPKDIRHFNWGAFLLNWIWGLMHRKYITLLYFPACIIPIIGPVAISIWFGLMGNRWAWKSRNWASVEEFNRVQKDYIFVWLILFLLGLIISVKVILLLLLITNINI